MRNLSSLGLAVAVAGFGILVYGCGSPPPPKAPEPAPSATVAPPPAASVAPTTTAPADRDGDTVIDSEDRCPDVAGKVELKGCPDKDNDGIADIDDKCPDLAGDAKYQGCPFIYVDGGNLVVNAPISFDEDKDVIKPDVQATLEKVAAFLKDHAEVQYVEIAGHADVKGKEAVNKPLSEKRAKAVMAALEKLKVEKTRVRAVGYSDFCLADVAKTDQAAAKDRLVKFKVLRYQGELTSIKWGGCDNATTKGKMKPIAVPDLPKPKPVADTKKPADKKPADAKKPTK